MHRPVRRLLLPLGLAAVLALGACSPDAAPTDSDPPEQQQRQVADGAPRGLDATAAPVQYTDAEPVVATTTVWSDGEEVDLSVSVGPVVREDDLAVLPLTFEVVGDQGEINLMSTALRSPGLSNDPTQVRLVDTERMAVSQPAMQIRQDNNNRALVRWTDEYMPDHGRFRAAAGEDPVTWAGVFGAPQADHTAVLLQHFGLIPEVPVVDEAARDVPSAADLVEGGTLADVMPRVFPIESYREHIDTPVGTRTESDRTTVTIATDVLFDVDSADLSADADTALQAAAQELADVDGGDLAIVGHTDDVLDEDHNQALSEARAQAVHDRLEDVADLSVFDEVSTEGRAFHEPVVPNDSEDNRALNRRVELHFTPPGAPQSPRGSGDFELPGTDGPVGASGDGVEVVRDVEDDVRVHVSVDSIERVDRVLVGQVRVQQIQGSGSDGSGQIAWPLTGGVSGPRGTGLRPWEHSTTDTVTLLAAGQRLFPLDYFVSDLDDDDAEPTLYPLTDRHFAGDYAPGESRVATVLWPALAVDEVTVDVPAETDNAGMWHSLGVDPWRITDVPVE